MTNLNLTNLTNQERTVLNQILEKRKGTYMKICSKKNLEPLKKYQDEFTNTYKLSTYLCRYGVRTQNMSSYKDKEVKELPWGQYVPGYEGILIEHKNQYYIRVVTSGTKARPTTEYVGLDLSKDKEKFRAGTFEKKESTDVFCINLKNIVRVF